MSRRRRKTRLGLSAGWWWPCPSWSGRKCDFWDLWHERGAEAVQSAIASAKAPDIEGTTAHSTHEAEDLAVTVRRLAALSPIEYDRVRQAEADALGVRVTTLDAEVEKVRRKLAGDGNDSQGEAVLFPDIEPWPEPVDGGELLTDLAATCRSLCGAAQACRHCACVVDRVHARNRRGEYRADPRDHVAGKAMRQEHGARFIASFGAPVPAVCEHHRPRPCSVRSRRGRRRC